LAQEHLNKEIIVVDDASTDGSLEILEGYGDAIKLIALRKNGGANAARNLGAALACGDFFVFLDGDDLLLPWALNVYNRIIDLKNPKLILCSMLWFKDSFSSVNIGGFFKEIRVVDYGTFLKKDRPYRASASAMVIERQVFHNVDGFSKDAWPVDDAEIMLKLGYAGRTISIILPQTSAYRQHANNTSLQIQSLIDGVHVLIRKEKSKQHLGSQALSFERYAAIGGIVFYWLKRTFRQRLFVEFCKLLAVGWPMVLSAIFRRSIAFVGGRRPVEIIQFQKVKTND